MNTFLAILSLAVSAFAIAGIFWPRVRGVWKGTSVRVSTISSIGFALIFASAGVALLWHAHIGIPILLGMVCVFVGQFWDFRKGGKI